MLTIIPHISQRTKDDCGIACVTMLLAGMGRPLSHCEIESYMELKSVWTIDLAYILKENNVNDFTMYTKHIGVNWNHAGNEFYSLDYQKDMKRVHSKFAKARENGIRVVPTPLPMLDICRFLLSNRYAVIVLVNGNTLACTLCAEKQRRLWWKSVCCAGASKPRIENTHDFGNVNSVPVKIPASPSSSIGSSSVSRRLSFGALGSPSSTTTPGGNVNAGHTTPLLSKKLPNTSVLQITPTRSYGSIPTQSAGIVSQSYDTINSYLGTGRAYAGHYIVLIGYDKENDMFFYRDPGTDSELCVVGFEDLEAAMSEDTDKDLIVARVL